MHRTFIPDKNYGQIGEETVEKVLRAKGWKTFRSPGSRGPADIFAIKESQKWCIQVKVRATFGPRTMRKEEERKLLRYSVVSCCRPVVAVISIHAYNLLCVATNVVDADDSSLVRDPLGNPVAVNLGKRSVLYLYDLRTGHGLEP